MASLLERLGGRDGVAVVIAGLVGRIRADPRLIGRCAGVARLRHEQHLAEYVGAILEGVPRQAFAFRAPRGRPPDAAAIELFLDHLADTLVAAGVSSRLSDDVVRAVTRACDDLTWDEIFG